MKKVLLLKEIVGGVSEEEMISFQKLIVGLKLCTTFFWACQSSVKFFHMSRLLCRTKCVQLWC